MIATGKALSEVMSTQKPAMLKAWLEAQLAERGMRSELLSRQELQDQSSKFLNELSRAVSQAGVDTADPAFDGVRHQLEDLTVNRARQGYTPTETATFIFSLKQPLFAQLRGRFENDPAGLASNIWEATVLVDRLGLFTMEVYQKGRDQMIVRQQEEMLELSTPVITLWKGILALPLIGTLDSARTQVVMENLLQRIVETGAPIAIIDITGVPTVDTLTAQHLLKTVAAARLMGADCIISGIRPQIAQTIVHLGVELEGVVTKSSLADAFAVALKRNGLSVQRAVDERKPAQARRQEWVDEE